MRIYKIFFSIYHGMLEKNIKVEQSFNKRGLSVSFPYALLFHLLQGIPASSAPEAVWTPLAAGVGGRLQVCVFGG